MVGTASCNEQDELAEQSTATPKTVQKTARMIEFEQGFRGMGNKIMNVSHGKTAQQASLNEVMNHAEQYLEDNGQAVSQTANHAQVLKQALDFHAQELRNLANSQNSN